MVTEDLLAARLFDVSGKVALITGGGSGIGLMLARALRANGAKVYLCGRDESKLAAASAAADCVAIPADVSQRAGMDGLHRELASREQRLDILVHNAGTSWVAPAADFPEAGWDKVFDLNTRAPFFLTQALMPLLERDGQDWSSVIMVTSARARTAASSSVAYNVSKAATTHLVRVLARALAAHRIRVNAIQPGWFETDMNRDYVARHGDELVRDQTVPRLGTEADLAGAVLYLGSRSGSFLNGTVLEVDGGLISGL